ncbi:MAG TPA: hypothetical protein VKS01_07370 [Bryobacteraceae bacterium]|nr:hypothetical protein [Bryobacteraceae bacterium]
MDHAEAQQMRAVERYALGDLSVSEVEEFERHFFDCPQCSEELRLLSVFQENARAVFIEQAQAPSVPSPVIERNAGRARGFRSWWSWIVAGPALAMLAAGVFAGYEAGERKSGEPQSIDAYPLYAASRGSETVVSPPAVSQFFTLYMDRTWDRDYSSYRAIVRDQARDPDAGAERASLPIEPPAPGRAIQVLFPARSLSAGRYVLSILGKDSSGQETKVADYSFTLRFE